MIPSSHTFEIVLQALPQWGWLVVDGSHREAPVGYWAASTYDPLAVELKETPEQIIRRFGVQREAALKKLDKEMAEALKANMGM